MKTLNTTITLCGLMFWASVVSAAPGDLDPTFDGDGVAVINTPGNTQDYGRAVAIDASGNVIVAGNSGDFGSSDFMVARFTPAGTPDTGFNGDGYLIDDFNGRGDQANGVAVDAAGNIAVTGRVNLAFNALDFGIALYDSSGNLQTGFNGTGHVVIDVGNNDEGDDIMFDSAGRIVAAGDLGGMSVVRYNLDGTPDNTFNGSGVSTAQAGDVEAMDIDGDGKIVIAGGNSSAQVTISRFNADGTLDTSFDGDGNVATSLGGNQAGANAVAIDADNRIVVAGQSNPGTGAQFFVARFNTDGSFDTTFNGTGFRLVDVSAAFDLAFGVAVTSSGKIVAAGNSGGNTSLVSFNADGTLDSDFGVGGIANVDMTGTGQQDWAHDLVIDSNNRLVIAGQLFITDFRFGLAAARFDNAAPGTLQFSAATVDAAEGDGSVTITVDRINGADGTVSVDYATADGTAVAGSDYTATSGTLTFEDGESSMTFAVPILQDAIDENDETVSLSLTNPTGGAALGTPDVATLTIIDDDDAPAISIDDVTLAEGDSGTQDFEFTVSLSTASGLPISVDFATADGTATAPGDYTSNSGTLDYLPGETTMTVAVAVIGDTVPEDDETFTVDLTNPVNATLADSSGTGTIVDDDPPGTVALDLSNTSVGEADGDVSLTVTRTGGDSGAVSVDFSTADGTAVAGSDYIADNGTLSWADGDATPRTITIAILDDDEVEDPETFSVILSNPSGGAIIGGNDSTVITIDDDDVALPNAFTVPVMSNISMLIFASLLALLGLFGVRARTRT